MNVSIFRKTYSSGKYKKCNSVWTMFPAIKRENMLKLTFTLAFLQQQTPLLEDQDAFLKTENIIIKKQNKKDKRIDLEED